MAFLGFLVVVALAVIGATTVWKWGSPETYDEFKRRAKEEFDRIRS